MTQSEVADPHCDGFQSLRTQSRGFLDEIQGRSLCPKCQKSRKFYCYTCYILMDNIKEKLKHVKLPVKVDIIKHPNEVDGKSTAPHARVVSPEDVSIYTYPCIPDYNRDKVILVFPCEESVTLDELGATTSHTDRENSPGSSLDVVRPGLDSQTPGGTLSAGKPETLHSNNNTDSCGEGTGGNDLKRKATSADDDDGQRVRTEKLPRVDLADSSAAAQSAEFANADIPLWKSSPGFDKVVFIDSTWLQSKKIFSDERLKGLRPVELKSRHTKYWRPQGDHPDTYLATIEAIYYFFVDFHKAFVSDQYTGDYDNLLFFFLYAYDKVQSSKDSKKTRKR